MSAFSVQTRIVLSLSVLSVLIIAGAALYSSSFSLLSPSPASAPDELPYNRTQVDIVNETTATTLASVDVRIADTDQKRYTGLSNTDSLPPDTGMLFVHPQPGSYQYVMRNMSFPIDIVFIDADGTVTHIHHAPVPPAGESSPRYEGRGQYVLELSYRYTTNHNISVGDEVKIPASAQAE